MDRHTKHLVKLRICCLVIVIMIILAFYFGVWALNKFVISPAIKAVEKERQSPKYHPKLLKLNHRHVDGGFLIYQF